jgi:hypothetical protein
LAVVPIGPHPDLTKAELVDIFQRGLGDRYQVYESKALMTDLMVKKSGWTGCGVQLQHKDGESHFVTRQNFGNPMYAMFMGSLLSMLVLRKGWQALEQEVVTFIQNEPAFK